MSHLKGEASDCLIFKNNSLAPVDSPQTLFVKRIYIYFRTNIRIEMEIKEKMANNFGCKRFIILKIVDF